jgi:hypothetical protein
MQSTTSRIIGIPVSAQPPLIDLFRTGHRLPVNYQLVNRLISVNYSFRHVVTIRLTLAPHRLEILSHLHGISTPLAPEDSI